MVLPWAMVWCGELQSDACSNDDSVHPLSEVRLNGLTRWSYQGLWGVAHRRLLQWRDSTANCRGSPQGLNGWSYPRARGEDRNE